MNPKPDGDGRHLDDVPIAERCRENMASIARGLDAVLNGDLPDRPYGYILMMFPFGTPEPDCYYISSADRQTMEAILRAKAGRIEEQFKEIDQ
jgi:hypothetical protein